MDKERLQQIYTDIAPQYDEIVIGEAGYTAHGRISRLLLRHLSSLPYGNEGQRRVLDLGCGTGLSSLLFFERGDRVVGVDLAPGMIEQARKHPYEQLVCQSLEEELQVQGVFDACVMIGVMEFIQKPLQLFQRVHSLLSPEGLFALTIPQKLPPETSLSVKSYTRDEIEGLFEDFRILNSCEFFGYEKQETQVQYHGFVLQRL